jgi:glycosyltransferase involved in cell wall biosynthesis
MPPKLSVIIPVFNEEPHVEEIVAIVQSVAIDKELIIVNDGSKDASDRVIRENILPKYPNVTYLVHDRNQGKGSAIRTGIAAVRGEFALIQDADLEYDPKDYPALLDAFSDPSIRIVYGSRFLSGKKVTNPFHYLVNRFITETGNLLFGGRLTDLETCYKMFRSQTLKDLDLVSAGFEIEAEITCKALKKRLKIVEVPISYRGRNYEQGKKITWVDGIKAIWTLVKLRVSS